MQVVSANSLFQHFLSLTSRTLAFEYCRLEDATNIEVTFRKHHDVYLVRMGRPNFPRGATKHAKQIYSKTMSEEKHESLPLQHVTFPFYHFDHRVCHFLFSMTLARSNIF
jgi:hypothetical protein